MTQPVPPPARPPGNSFSAEDATEQALSEAFTAAVTAWLAATAAAVMAGGLVPNLSLMSGTATFAAHVVPRVAAALREVWVRAYARTGQDLRGFIDAYLTDLPNRLDGLTELATRRSSTALQDSLSTGNVEKIREAVRAALAPTLYEGYIHRLAQTEASISVNAARHDIAAASYRQGLDVEKVWHTRDDRRVRHTHAQARGQTVPFNTPFWVGGIPMQHPGDPAAPPSEVMNCRCQARYIIRGRR